MNIHNIPDDDFAAFEADMFEANARYFNFDEDLDDDGGGYICQIVVTVETWANSPEYTTVAIHPFIDGIAKPRTNLMCKNGKAFIRNSHDPVYRDFDSCVSSVTWSGERARKSGYNYHILDGTYNPITHDVKWAGRDTIFTSDI